nr:histone-binding protein RBBP7-like [Dermatophagoides farinae]
MEIDNKSDSSDDSDYDPDKSVGSDEQCDEDDDEESSMNESDDYEDDDDYDDNCDGDDESDDDQDEDCDNSELKSSYMPDVIDQIVDGRVKIEVKDENNPENEQDDDVLPMIDEFDLERYRIWKKNCQFLYDLIITNRLEWPSITVQWCHSKQTKTNPYNNREYSTDKLLFGTHVDENNQNHLIVATQHTPIIDRNQIAACEGGVSHTKYAKLENYVRIIHDGDINRARYNPQNSFIIATSSSSAKNYIFDYSKHPSEPASKEFKPELILDHHQQEGYGLCWNTRKSNILATGSQDEKICIWDINSNPSKSKTLTPVHSFKAHGSVNDVKWHYYHESYLGSVGNDKMLKFWDSRMNGEIKAAFCSRVHNEGVNSLSFNQFCEYVILTGSDDHTVGLFDIRNLKHRLHSFDAHRDEVLDVNWSPYGETVFASSSRDKRLIIWDMTKINAPQSIQAAQEGPPEMIFIHGGHTDIIQDFSWHPHNQLIASVSANNELHVFKPSIDIKLSI